ncbi:MAG TPA: hypothetical protein VM032_15080 [Vicinamibacterales bacterium]|nr:hypothetical protein [Vicinamibacterales bacterium]
MRSSLTAAIVILIGSTTALNGAQPLTIQVSPRVAMAPAYARIRVHVEPRAENRVLEISATSPEFERSSSIQLNGARAPRLSVVDYPNLPSGSYEVTVALVDSLGHRVVARQSLEIVAGAGPR